MKQVFIFIFTFFLAIFDGYSQNPGYIIKGDSAYAEGLIIFDPTNPKEVKVLDAKKTEQIYNAHQLSGFGYKNGPKYLSKKIFLNDEHDAVFLELIEEGELNLFSLSSARNHYFLEKDSLLQLDQENYHHILKEFSGACKSWEKQYKLINYNRRSLSYYIRHYNSNKCRNIPMFSIGPVVGYSMSGISIPVNSYVGTTAESISLNSFGVNIGLFAEFPIWQSNGFSFLSEMRFGKQQFIEEFIFSQVNQDIKIETSSLNLNIAPKYTFNTKKHRPYLFLGGSLNYILKSSTEIFEAVKTKEEISFGKLENSIGMPQTFYGIAYGTGLKIFYSYKHYLNFEVSGSNGFSDSSISLKTVQFSVKTNL